MRILQHTQSKVAMYINHLFNDDELSYTGKLLLKLVKNIFICVANLYLRKNLRTAWPAFCIDQIEIGLVRFKTNFKRVFFLPM